MIFQIEIDVRHGVDQPNEFSHGRATKMNEKYDFLQFLGSTPWFCMIFHGESEAGEPFRK